MDANRPPIRTVAFKTLGCKLNQSETDAIATKFQERGYATRAFGETADLTVINTCTVTSDADAGSRAAIRQAVRVSPEGRIAVTGCYAQVNPDDIKALQGVDLILGNDEKYRIFDYLDALKTGKAEEPLVYVNDEGEFDSVGEDGFVSATNRARAFMKVQEGCNYYCSYCIIPFSRGRARSRSYFDAITEARRLADQGYRELVLTGINIGTYEYRASRSYTLVELLDGMQQVPGIERIRLSSIEPNTVTDELLKLLRDSKVLCPHLHIPLQGGSDDMLTAMHRKYTIADYAELMSRFREFLPDAALGTDIITGFPGETDAHFAATLDLIAVSPFTYLHVFRYSPRQGTAAAKLKNPVDPMIVKKRAQILHQTGKDLKRDYQRRFIGKTFPVLFDQEKDGDQIGYTPNYIQVRVSGVSNLRKSILPVRLELISPEGMVRGELTVTPTS